MNLLNVTRLKKFGRKHRDAIDWLDTWRITVDAAQWQNIEDLRKVYRSADGVPIKTKGGDAAVVTIFNVKGNRYRLLTLIDYRGQNVLVLDVLTHAQYSRNNWKEQL